MDEGRGAAAGLEVSRQGSSRARAWARHAWPLLAAAAGSMRLEAHNSRQCTATRHAAATALVSRSRPSHRWLAAPIEHAALLATMLPAAAHGPPRQPPHAHPAHPPSPATALGLSTHTATSRGSALRPPSVMRSQISVWVHSRYVGAVGSPVSVMRVSVRQSEPWEG